MGRIEWLLRPTRTCPRQGTALIRRAAVQGNWSNYLDLDVVAGTDAELAGMATTLARREVSPLQDYAARRLRGGAGPAWLDGQPLDEGVRSVEMIGACLAIGTELRVQDLTEDDWDAAGRAGFALAARGPEGI